MRPPLDIRVPRRVSLDDLVDALVTRGLVREERAALVRREADLRRASLARAKTETAKLAGVAMPTDVSPVEVVLSFNEPADAPPLREDVVTELWAELLGMPYVKLDPLELDPAFAMRIVSKPFARKNGYLAIDEQDGVVRIATHRPLDRSGVESIERMVRKKVALVVASQTDVERLITEFYGFRQSVKRAEQQISTSFELGNLEQLVRMKSDAEIESSDQHVVHAVDYMFRYAFGQRASDIHIEPKRNESLVRYRIDGALHTVNRIPRVVHNAIVNRIKTLSRLDIAEKRRPQDGRIKTDHDAKHVEMRVSTLPVAFGEKVVLRIFDPATVSTDFATLGFTARDRLLFERLITRPHGILLVTGPTGSGKTTTLYTALKRIAADDVNVTTIEDPIENVFEDINQTAIQPAIGIGFAEALRTLLRQDPDVIMIGEIRDAETARNAIQAALTGHLVLSTLHTNDAPSAVTRLADLGVPRYLLASTLLGVMAQRLVRRICTSCAAERTLDDDEAEILGFAPGGLMPVVHYGQGCADCRSTGYRGRDAIVELFEVTPPMRRLIHETATEDAMRSHARTDGMTSLREAGIEKMLRGETTYDEVVAVTSDRGD